MIRSPVPASFAGINFYAELRKTFMQNLSFDHIIGVQAGQAFAKLASKENRPRRRRERRRATQYTTNTSNPPRTLPNPNGSLPPSQTPTYSHIQVINQDELMAAPPRSSPRPTFTKPSLEFDTAQQGTSAFTLEQSLSADNLANNTQGTTFAARARAAELQAARTRRELKARTDLAGTPTHETVTFKSKSKGKTWKPLDLSDLLERPVDVSQDPSLLDIETEIAENFQEDLVPGSAQDFEALDTIEGISSSEHPTDIPNEPTMAPKAITDLPPTSKISDDSFGIHDAAQWNEWNRRYFPSQTMFHEPESGSQSHRQPIQQLDEQFNQQPNHQFDHQADHQFNQQFNHGLAQQLNQQPNQKPNSERPSYEDRRASLEPIPESMGTSYLNLTQGVMDEPRDELAELQNRLLAQTSRRPLADTYLNPVAHSVPVRYKPPKQYPAVKGTMNPGFRFPPPGLPSPTTQSSIGTGNLRKSSGEVDKDILLQKLHEVAQSASSQGHESSTRTEDERSRVASSDLALANRHSPWNKEDPMPIASSCPRSTDYPETDANRANPSEEMITMAPLRPGSTNSASWNRGENEQKSEIDAWFHQDNRVSRSRKVFMEDFVTDARNDSNARAASDQAALRRANFSDASSEYLTRPIAPSTSGTYESSGQMARDLLLPVLGNLQSYKTRRDYFNMSYGEAPQWCIDHSSTGNQSFFGGDWGTPPPRVGRDPRYRPAPHDGDARYRSYDSGGNTSHSSGMAPRWNMWG